MGKGKKAPVDNTASALAQRLMQIYTGIYGNGQTPGIYQLVGSLRGDVAEVKTDLEDILDRLGKVEGILNTMPNTIVTKTVSEVDGIVSNKFSGIEESINKINKNVTKLSEDLSITIDKNFTNMREQLLLSIQTTLDEKVSRDINRLNSELNAKISGLTGTINRINDVLDEKIAGIEGASEKIEEVVNEIPVKVSESIDEGINRMESSLNRSLDELIKRLDKIEKKVNAILTVLSIDDDAVELLLRLAEKKTDDESYL